MSNYVTERNSTDSYRILKFDFRYFENWELRYG